MDDKFLYELRQKPQPEFTKALLEKINKKASTSSAINSLFTMAPALVSVSIFCETSSNIIQTLFINSIKQLKIMSNRWKEFLFVLILSTIFVASKSLVFIHMISGFISSNIINGISLMMVSIIERAGLGTLTNKFLVLGLCGIIFIPAWIGQIGTIFNNLLDQCIDFAEILISNKSLYYLTGCKTHLLNISSYIFACIIVILGITLFSTTRKQNFLQKSH